MATQCENGINSRQEQADKFRENFIFFQKSNHWCFLVCFLLSKIQDACFEIQDAIVYYVVLGRNYFIFAVEVL